MITPSGATAAQIWASVKAGEPIHAELEFLSQGITLTDGDFELNGGIEVSNVLNGDIDLVFGRAVAKQLTCHILNSSKLNGLIWTDEIQLTWKIDVNGVEKSVPGGYFCGEKPANVTTDNVIEFTAYDRMKKFDILVDGYLDTVTYPITIGNFYNGLCTFCGVSKVSGDELPNMIGRTLSAAPADFQGYTCRDVLAWIAEACGCYAMCNADGKIQLRWFTDYTSHAVSEHEEFGYESGDINDGLTWDEADQLTWNQIDMMTWNDVGGWQETFTVDQLSVKSLGENVTIDYPSAIGGNVYTIIDNPFLFVETPQDVTDYIKPIYDRLALFGAYLPIKLECIGDPTVEAGDIITVVIEGNTLTVPIFVKTVRWNGSMVDECETTGQQQRDTYTSDANRQKVLDNNSIRLFVKGKYYEHQSGIEITADGVTVSGGKYVKVDTGGVFSVNGSDFTIDSTTKKIKIGKWTFNEYGLDYTSGSGASYRNIWLMYGTDQAVLGYANNDYSGGLSIKLVLPKYTAIEPGRKEGCVDSYLCSFTEGSIDELEAYHLYLLGSGSKADGDLVSDNTTDLKFHMESTDASSAGSGDIKFSLGMYTLYWGTPGTYLPGINSDLLNCKEIIASHVGYGTLHQMSSKEIKHDIEDLPEQGETLDKLRPVSFVYNDDEENRKRFGLIHEETVGILPEICTGDEKTKAEYKAISYVDLIPLLLKEIQSLRKRVAALEEKVGVTN